MALRRKQVMISDWLDDYMQELSKIYDVSYSEIVRAMLSYAFGSTVSQVHPEYKFSIDAERMANAAIERNDGKIDIEANRKLLADIYYEARQLIEQHLQELKKVGRPS